MAKIGIIEMPIHHGCKPRLSSTLQQLTSPLMSLFSTLRESKNIPMMRGISLLLCSSPAGNPLHIPHPKRDFKCCSWHFSSLDSDTIQQENAKFSRKIMPNSAGKCQIQQENAKFRRSAQGVGLVNAQPSPCFHCKWFFVHIFLPNLIFFQHIHWVYNAGGVAGNVRALNGIPDAASQRILRERQVNLFFLSKCHFRCKKP